jgi:glutaredoxin
MDWIIYGTDWCSPCKQVKSYLKKHYKDNYTIYTIEDVDETADKLAEKTNNFRKIPMVFYKGKFMGSAKEFFVFQENKKDDEITFNDEF